MALNRKLTVPALVAMSIRGAACGSTQSTDKVTLPNGAQVTNVKKAVEDAKNRAAAASQAVGAGEQSAEYEGIALPNGYTIQFGAKLGMTMAEARAKFGQPSNIDAASR